jgi:tryptophan synthase alpha subunit
MTSSTLIKSFERAKEDNRAALLTYTVGGDPDKKNISEYF